MLQIINSDARWVRWGTLIVGLVGGALIWQIAGMNFNPAIMAPLFSVEGHPGAGNRLIELIFFDPEYQESFLISARLFITGLAIAILIAVPIGILLARLATLRAALENYILVLYATPMVALIPFILATIGFNFWPKVLVVVLFAFFPILYNTLEGARSVRPELLEVARSFRSNEMPLWRDIYIPYTLPFAMTGIRQATGRALVGMIAAEFFLSSSGLGKEIVISSRNFDMAEVLATIVLITICGVVLMRGVQALEQHLAAWRGTER